VVCQHSVAVVNKTAQVRNACEICRLRHGISQVSVDIDPIPGTACLATIPSAGEIAVALVGTDAGFVLNVAAVAFLAVLDAEEVEIGAKRCAVLDTHTGSCLGSTGESAQSHIVGEAAKMREACGKPRLRASWPSRNCIETNEYQRRNTQMERSGNH
jgi:hypothetical protein